MSALWKINGNSLEDLGLTMAGLTFRAQAASTAQLRREVNCDTAEILGFGAAVTLTRGLVTVFQGKVNSTPKSATGDKEAQTIEITDAWDDLEKTIYQEEWYTGATPDTAMIPRAVLGLVPDGATWKRGTVGEMVERIIDYAISQGVNLQKGSIPLGETMIPTEVQNSTCAELIRECLRLHPDWIPYITHTTTPPTFAVAPASSATAASFDLTGGTVQEFNIVHRTDMLPASVRIVYELAGEIDGEVYRKTIIDKWPLGGPDGGPRCIMATIPLAGMVMQIQ